MWNPILIALSVLAIAVPVSASDLFHDDTDLGGGRRARPRMPALELRPDSILTVNNNGPLTLRVIRMDRGIPTEVTGILARLPDRPLECSNGMSSYRLQLPLANSWIQVTQNGDAPYQIVADLPCEGTFELIFEQDSVPGQALGIWQVAERARLKLESSVGLGFWTRPIRFYWPDEADYYSWNAVHLTRGDHWDVVGHEMGHAIYDQAQLGGLGGGPHRIDECYSESLALSEGWASFFSAWVSLDPSDPDARFEYMVPRRAPIQIENIPDDVCRGPGNEWRVSGFFWDLIDTHEDSESASERFERMWLALRGSRVPSAKAAKERISSIGGVSPELLKLLWTLNGLD